MKYKPYIEEIRSLSRQGYTHSEIARIIKEDFGLNESVNAIRKGVKRIESKHEALVEYADKKGIPVSNVSSYWHKGKHFSVHVKGDATPSWEDVKDRIIEEMQCHAPMYEKREYRQFSEDRHCLVVDPADVHIGKLASSFESSDEYNRELAVARVHEGVGGILERAKGFEIDKIVFIGGNDILHVDTPRSTTTSGTPQDTDGMWYDNFLAAKQLYVSVLENLLSVAPVHFVFNPSNHDYTHGFFLADVIRTWFKNEPFITFDCSISHRKYFKYGSNLIGTTHGDGAKNADLPLLMATEAPVMWSETKHRYIYTHHVHHKTSKDYQGVTIESLRSPSGTDSWHHRKGYEHSPKAIEAFLHSYDHGQVARLTYLF